MQAYRVCHTPITFAVGQQLGLSSDQVAARSGLVAVLETQPDRVVVSAEAPLSFKVGEIVRIAGDVSRLGQRDLPGPQLEPV